MRILILLLVISFGANLQLAAQERCYTVPYMKALQEKNQQTESPEQFEQWLQNKMQQRTQAFNNQRLQSGPYKVPVVVHVIHNGQPEGTGMNISDAQIVSQIDVLNKDFNRLNTDATNTPTWFQPVAAGMGLEFVLAKSDPNGQPTSGIVRVNGGQATWNATTEDALLKSKSYWNSENYLNIWVTDLANNYLGYAQFPSSTLPGLSTNPGAAETDGLVLDYTVCGVYASNPPEPKYNLGRTATHELGHFFGLRHIWGDESQCSADDYVDDTPKQEKETLGICPTSVRTDACSSVAPGIMYQNYMDYTNDACMNLFTQQQIERMVTILESSPRRLSLLSSPGLVPPSGFEEDLKITKLTSSPVTCSTSSVAQLTVKNVSTTDIDIWSFKVNIFINSNPGISESYTGFNIAQGEEYSLTIPVELSADLNTVRIEVHSPNNSADVSPLDNQSTIYTIVNNSTDEIPLREQFDASNEWEIINPTGGTLWEGYSTNFKTSPYFDAYDNPIIKEQSWLVTPVLDFSKTTNASVLFDLSYAWNGLENDSLKIVASTDCGQTYDHILFKNGGSGISNYTTNTEWFANNEADWSLQKYINLNELAGESQVRIAFVAQNHSGNNIFLDNIEFFVSDEQDPFDPGTKQYEIYWVNGAEANITFNLNTKQTVDFQITDILGRNIFQVQIPEVLNQTYAIPMGLSAPGLYLFRLYIDNKYYTTKIYLAP